MRRTTTIALLSAALVSVPAAGVHAEEDIDYLDLAGVLIRDGKYDRASNTLSQVDLEREDLDRARFHFLRGLVRLNLSLYSQAAEDFDLAVRKQSEKAEQDEEVTLDRRWYVYLAQAYFYSNQYEKSLDAFARAGEVADAIQSTFALRGEAFKKLERYEEAWAIFTRGIEQYPDYQELKRRRVFLAIDRKLYQAAADLGRDYLRSSDATAKDYLAIGAALYQAGSRSEALEFFELANLQFPRSERVALELAKLYKDKSMYRTAALILERASLGGSDDLAVEAAELYRRAGEPFLALSLNARVADSEKRLRQRLGILLEMRRYELVALMDRDLRRVGLLEDESLKYALAYAFFKTGNYERADELLSGLKDPSVFRQATELRKAMADCQDERWRC